MSLTSVSLEAPDRLAVALVGAGDQGAGVLLPTLRGLPGVEVVAVCDTVRHRAMQAAARAGVGGVYRSLADALAARSLDAIVVACPPAAHRSALELAFAHGVPIFVEKPPAASMEELAIVAAAAKRSKRLVGVGMNFRYATAIEHVHDLINEGKHGRILYLSIRHMANKPRTSLWGESVLRSMLLAQLVHPVDLAIHLVGEVSEVRTKGTFRGDEITLVSTLVHSGGATTSIVASTAARRFAFALTAITDRGVVIECRDLWEVTLHGSPAAPATAWAELWSAGPLDRGYGRSGYEGELAAFFAAVRGEGPFRPDLDDLIPTYRILDEVHDALEPHAR